MLMKIDRQMRLAVLLGCVSLVAAAPPAGHAAAPFEVQCDQGLLTVTADKAALGDVLHEVARRCRIEARGIDGLDRDVQVKFSAVPMRDGIVKLMGKANFALIEVPFRPRHPRHLALIVVDSPSGRAEQPLSGSAKTSKAGKLNPDEESIRQVNQLERSAKNGADETLRHAAAEGDPTIQAVALELLAKEDPERAAGLAANCVKSGDPNRRITGVQTLAGIDTPEAANALGSVLKDANTGVRESAVVALGSQTSPEAVSLLSRAVNDQDPSIRSMAMDFLAQRGREGEDVLRGLLYSDNLEVRAHARELLAQIGEE